MMKFSKMVAAVEEEFLEFDNIPVNEKRHTLPDLCGMLYLHEKLGKVGDSKAVAAAEHYNVYLRWGGKELKKLTQEDVLYITRCGISYDDNTESLYIMV